MMLEKRYVNHFNKGMKKIVHPRKGGRNKFDLDGDGVPNLMDCQPRNYKRQGVVHDVAAHLTEKSTGYVGKKAHSYFKHKQEVSKVRMKARREQELESAEVTEKMRAQSSRKRFAQHLNRSPELKPSAPLNLGVLGLGGLLPEARKTVKKAKRRRKKK